MKHIIHIPIIAFSLLTLGVTAVTTTPVHAEKLTEEQALAQIKTALKKVETEFTPQNLQSALKITDKVGGLDNEAAMQPWVQFCKKHKSKVFIALDGSKNPKKHAEILSLITDYAIESGMKIPQADYDEFLKNNQKLQKIIDG